MRAAGRLATLLVVALLTGCGAGGVVVRPSQTASPPETPASGSPSPTGSGSPTGSPSPTGSASVTPAIPADGIALAAYGYANGPVRYFSVPRGSYLTSTVDQANNVVAVISTPPADAVAAYLRRALPAGGFAIDRDDPAAETLTFHGYGWSGSFTATDSTSAVLLRPS